ncbi:MAG: hypothetical protein ABR529_00295 [Actinomycetota bacterium]
MYARLEWSKPKLSDIDENIFDSKGAMVATSETFNNPLDEVTSPVWGRPNGGEGFELVNGMRSGRCEGVTLLSEASQSVTGEEMTLELWLGPIVEGMRS